MVTSVTSLQLRSVNSFAGERGAYTVFDNLQFVGQVLRLRHGNRCGCPTVISAVSDPANPQYLRARYRRRSPQDRLCDDAAADLRLPLRVFLCAQ